LHKYIYASNNLSTLIDPTGKFSLLSQAAAVAILTSLAVAGISDILAPNPLQTPTNPKDIAPNNPYKLFLEIGLGLGLSVAVGVRVALSAILKGGFYSGSNPILGLPRVGSALKVDYSKPVYNEAGKITREFPNVATAHGFPNVVDNFADKAIGFKLPDGALLYQLGGSFNKVSGRFEWIAENGQITHRMFVKGGTINGIPIQP
jgi:hypothetical protein